MDRTAWVSVKPEALDRYNRGELDVLYVTAHPSRETAEKSEGEALAKYPECFPRGLLLVQVHEVNPDLLRDLETADIAPALYPRDFVWSRALSDDTSADNREQLDNARPEADRD
jgi:hypothetical protein